MLRSIGIFTRQDALSCGAVGIVHSSMCPCVPLCVPDPMQVSLWVSALVMPIVAVREGGSLLLVATAVLQFVGTVLGDRVSVRAVPGALSCRSDRPQLDVLFASTAAGCGLLVDFPTAGCLLFGPSFGALFRHYLDCVWWVTVGPNWEHGPPLTRSAGPQSGVPSLSLWARYPRPESVPRVRSCCPQCVAGLVFVPLIFSGFGWGSILTGAATVAAVASVVVKADRRVCADSPAPPRVLYSYGCICAGIGCFSLGAPAAIAISSPRLPDGHRRDSGHLGFREQMGRRSDCCGGDRRDPGRGPVCGHCERVQLAEPQSAVPGRCVHLLGNCRDVHVGHGRGALSGHVGRVRVWRRARADQCQAGSCTRPATAAVLPAPRSLCFNASNVYFILSQRLADVAGPVLLASGLPPRALMQVAPAFISASLLLLPPGIERLSDIHMAGIR